jgi:hypothetical protein
MAATFAAVATLAALGSSWAVHADEYGRYLAMVILAVFGIMLLFPVLSDYLTRPLVSLGARLSQPADRESRNGGRLSPHHCFSVLPQVCSGHPVRGGFRAAAQSERDAGTD